MEDDFVLLTNYGKIRVKFYKDKIVYESDYEKDGFQINYDSLTGFRYDDEKKNLYVYLKKEPGIMPAKSKFLIFRMNQEGYEYIIEKISELRSDFKQIIVKSNRKYIIINRIIPYTILGIIALAIIIGVINQTPKTSRWDKLDDDQKNWYKRNYGNGQYEKYKKAINNYNSKH